MPGTNTSETASIIVKNLRTRYGLGSWTLKDISFEGYPGEIICIIGPNGAGKTTLLNLLAGCLFKTQTDITVLGMNRWKHNLDIRRQSTYMPAMQFTYFGRTPEQHWQAMALIYGMDEETYSARCMELVSDMNYFRHIHKPWETLSLGESHKGLLIGGFLPPVKLRILDEPIACGIDPLGMEILGVWMKEARARSETVIFSTQVLERAHLLADKLLILGNGTLRYFGPPSQLISDYNLDPTDDHALNHAFLKLFKDQSQ